jgi:hypothetical protein
MPKILNEYSRALGGRLYAETPKAVFAAIAVSALTAGGEQIQQADQRIIEEWTALYTNGVVSQAPPRSLA